MKKICIFLFCIFILILINLNQIKAEVNVTTSQNKPLDDFGKYAKSNVDYMAEYIKANLPDLYKDKSLGRIEVDSDGRITLFYKDKAVFAIPKGLKFEYRENKVSISGIVEPILGGIFKNVLEFPPIFLNSMSINIIKQGNINIELKEKNGISSFHITSDFAVNIYNYKKPVFDLKLVKEASIEYDKSKDRLISIDAKFGDYGGDILFDSTGLNSFKGEYKGLKSGILRFNENGDIEYAKLVSLNGGDYSFNLKGKNYHFVLQKNGELVFNPKENSLSGKEASLILDNQVRIESSKGFSAILNNEGKIQEATLSKYDKLWMKDKPVTSNRGEYRVFFEDKDLSEYKGNAVSLTEAGMKLKGFIRIPSLYDGLEENTYANFIFNDARVGGNFFEIYKGDALISNSKHQILIKNNNVFVKTNSPNINENALGFSYKNNNGEIVEGIFSRILIFQNTY